MVLKFLLILLLFCSLKADSRDILVHIFSTQEKLKTVFIQGSFSFEAPFKRRANNIIYKVNCKNKQIFFSGLPFKSSLFVLKGGYIKIRLINNLERIYTGTVFIKAKPDCELVLQNSIDEKTYIISVVGNEMPTNWPLEALKAQSVLAQTRLLNSAKQPVLPDSTNEQSYKGLLANSSKVQKAVQETWRQVLYYKNKPIKVFYHSTCGGQTSSGNYLKENYAYLSSVKCSYCGSSPFAKNKAVYIPALQIVQTDKAGRPISVKFQNKLMSGYEFWLKAGQEWGWGKIPGTYYWANGNFIYSRGAGHGVGLCQWGAKGLADKGQKYSQILNYYFPEAKIKTL